MATFVISGKSAKAPVARTDQLLLEEAGGTYKRVTADALHEHSRWAVLAAADYVAAPAKRFFNQAAKTFGAVATWEATTTYSLGDFVEPTTPNGFVYECVDAGDSDGSEPSWGTALGDDTVDDGATWRCRGAHVITTNEDLQALLPVGTPVRWKDANGTGWARVLGVSATEVAIMGDPIERGEPLTELAVGAAELATAIQLVVQDAYGDDASDLIADDLKMLLPWPLPPARLVGFAVRHDADDAGADQPTVNVEVGGNPIAAELADAGLSVSTTLQESPATTINQANADLDAGDLIEVVCTAAGTDGDASDLTVIIWAVLK